MKSNKFIVAGIIVLLTIVIENPVSAQTGSYDSIDISIPESLGLFENEEILEVSLTFDITSFKREKRKSDYFDAIFSIRLSDTDSIIKNIRVRSRGNSRLDLCAFPPIRINTETPESKLDGLEYVKNIKLVTHCNNGTAYEEYVLKEYLVYKLYNIVTDTSFRVRLLKINYFDTGRRGIRETKLGFLIEPVDMVEKRINCSEVEDLVIRSQFINHYQYDRLSIFQFMIGNSDWYLPNLHNLKAIRPLVGNPNMLALLPYDFDYTGFVDAHYAVPNEKYNLANVKQRIYLGLCSPDEYYKSILKEFENKRSDFNNVINKTGYLPEKEKQILIKYLDSFYKMYKRDRIINIIRSTCVNRSN